LRAITADTIIEHSEAEHIVLAFFFNSTKKYSPSQSKSKVSHFCSFLGKEKLLARL
jgi:hypothetical protein